MEENINAPKGSTRKRQKKVRADKSKTPVQMLVATPLGLELKPHCYSPPRSSTAAGTTIPGENDFAFDYREELERTSLSAEELFHGGKIRSLQFIQLPNSPNDGKSTESEKPRCSISQKMSPNHDSEKTELNRGRVRASSHGNRVSRSVSPARVSAYPWETTEEEEDRKERGSLKGSSSRRWKLMDLLLFRSSSEGRAERTEHAHTAKCSVLLKKHGCGENNVDGRLKSGRELQHYTVSRAAAAAEGLRKRTFLPYKKGILFFNGY